MTILIFRPVANFRTQSLCPYSNIFDWSSDLGGDPDGQALTHSVTQTITKILVRLTLRSFVVLQGLS